MNLRVFIVVGLILFLGRSIVHGQQYYALKFNDAGVQKKFPKKLKLDTSILYSVDNNVRALGYELIEKGYFLHEITIDTLEKLLIINSGRHFDDIILNGTQSAELSIFKKKKPVLRFNPKELADYLEQRTMQFANMGFPFVQISLDSIRISEAQIEANLKVSKGQYYTFKKLHIKGDSSVSQRTIQAIIDYQLDEAYAELKVRDVDRKIEQCSFISSIKPAEIMYTSEGFEIFIYVKSIKVSFLRGALGLQPNPVSQKMALTGEINLKLENALKKGELLKFNWRSIKPQTQRMNFNFNYPYLFQSPFGIEAQLLLYKRDSTFLDLNTELNISYTLGNGFKLRAHYRFVQSSILSGAASNTEFSSLNGYRTNSYGLSVAKQKLNNSVNPSKGRIFSSKIYIGQRILDEDSTEILQLKNTTFSGHIIYREFLPVFPRHVLHLGAFFDFYSSTKIFENELYRFGGLNTLRGFNEEQLFASTKAQLTLEYRFLLDESSNVFLFYDQCFYENAASSYYNDNPFGFGGGISFGSNIGVFAITYAIGKEFSNPIDFRSSKIHFGYTAYF